jgi:NADPH:quinone reductase-like Zn-dependent oxidoreductase
MRALRVDRFGPLDALAVTDVPTPVPQHGDALIAIRAAAVSPFDVKSVTGTISLAKLPRIPGRDYAGVVVGGPPSLVGKEVWGSGGTLGLTHDGSHAEYLTVPAPAVREKPRVLDFAQAASVGVSYLAAWLGLVRAANVSSGDVVLIVGASGSVGGAAAQIARWRGARIIGADRVLREDQMFDGQVNTSTQDLAKTVKALTNGRGADVAFDTVGGALFESTLRSLRHRGRHVVINSAGERRVSFDLLDFYHEELTLSGIDTVKYDPDASAEVLDELRPGFETAALTPSKLVTFPLCSASDAYCAVQAGTSGSKVVLIP